MESDKDVLKRQAAISAAALVQPGMKVGLGTGSTAALMIAELIRRWQQDGLRFIGVPTSLRSATQAEAGGITLGDLADHPELDLAIDGADQIERHTLNLIKGMGGALLREKIVAAAAHRFVVIADDSKLATHLSLPVPVEVVRFGWQSTERRLQAIGAKTRLRTNADGTPYITDGGDIILDCDFGTMPNPAETDRQTRNLIGVIETGLFIGMTTDTYLATPTGLVHLPAA